MNMNLDDLEILLRNLMLSLGHASEMLPPPTVSDRTPMAHLKA